MTDEDLFLCGQCGKKCIELPAGLCAEFGIPNRRLVATGFLLYDPTQDADVPDLDTCDRGDCPGLGAVA